MKGLTFDEIIKNQVTFCQRQFGHMDKLMLSLIIIVHRGIFTKVLANNILRF